MRRLLTTALAAACLTSAALAQVVPPATALRTADGFAPHRAIYDLKLKGARWSADIAGMSGRLVSEFDDVCEGFTYNQRLVTNMTTADGTTTAGNYWVSTFETADGASFRFLVSNTVDGKQIEKTEGSATRQKDGAAEVSFTGPEGKKIVLPASTMFPTEFMGQAVAAAKAGKRSFSAHMFEGDGEGKVFDAYIAIGAERSANEAQLSLPGGEALKNQRAWPVTVSYYPTGTKDDLAEYETSFLLFENGITSDVTLDYGDFSLSATLRKLENGKSPRC